MVSFTEAVRCVMTTSPVDRAETIERLAAAVYPSFAMLAGMQLDVFTPLADGALKAEQIAQAIGVGVVKLKPLLHALVAAGLLAVKDDLFSNSQEASQFLVQGRPTYIGLRHHAYLRRWRSMLQVGECIRTGSPQGRLNYAAMSRNELESFYRGTYTEAAAAGRYLLAHRDFSVYGRLADVGGGSGGLAITIAQAHPGLRATVVDLPATTPIAEQYVRDAEMLERVNVQAADIVKAPLSGSYDVVVLRGLLIVLTPDHARQAIQNVSCAVEAGGAIFIVGWILDDSRVSPAELVAYNLHFINSLDEGQLYTEGELRRWLAEAGFVEAERERVTASDGTGFLVARKPT
jgi:2-polyprenyl-3-methyl-5-hydroxy-6-metoxy-1,4-benzoquinol methylase